MTPAWFILLGENDTLSNGVREQAIAINAADGSRIEINPNPMPMPVRGGRQG